MPNVATQDRTAAPRQSRGRPPVARAAHRSPPPRPRGHAGARGDAPRPAPSSRGPLVRVRRARDVAAARKHLPHGAETGGSLHGRLLRAREEPGPHFGSRRKSRIRNTAGRRLKRMEDSECPPPARRGQRDERSPIRCTPFAEEILGGIGTTIMGRNMFGGGPGPWGDDPWRGYWGEDPPYHH